MGVSAKELKAIAWYVREHQLKLQLSTPPTMYFKNADGEEVKTDLPGIVSAYESWNDQDKKERSREKRIATNERVRRVI